MNNLVAVAFVAQALLVGLDWAMEAKHNNDRPYKVLRAVPKSAEQLDFLKHLHRYATTYKLNFWKEPITQNSSVDLMAHPEGRRRLETLLKNRNISYTISIQDVQKLIHLMEVEKPKLLEKYRRRDFLNNSPYFNFQQFHSCEEINDYLYSVQRRYPDIARVHIIGYSHERRPILTIEIGYPLEKKNGNAMWIDAGMHAREWASQTSAVYLVHKLVADFSRRSSMRKYVYNLTWFVTPVANPDGYEYTRSTTQPDVRLWRKNRSPMQCYGKTNFCCKGVDLNRNFDFYWGGSGSSNFPCENTYGGKSAFSEPESRAIRDFVWARKSQIKAFITIHTYSQLWIHPFSHERNAYPEDLEELKNTAIKATEALKKLYGTEFKVGSGADLLYPSAGGSDDWSKSSAKIKYVYLLELRPDEDKRYGFIVDPEQLLPIARETWEGIRTVADVVLQKFALKE